MRLIGRYEAEKEEEDEYEVESFCQIPCEICGEVECIDANDEQAIFAWVTKHVLNHARP